MPSFRDRRGRPPCAGTGSDRRPCPRVPSSLPRPAVPYRGVARRDATRAVKLRCRKSDGRTAAPSRSPVRHRHRRRMRALALECPGPSPRPGISAPARRPPDRPSNLRRMLADPARSGRPRGLSPAPAPSFPFPPGRRDAHARPLATPPDRSPSSTPSVRAAPSRLSPGCSDPTFTSVLKAMDGNKCQVATERRCVPKCRRGRGARAPLAIGTRPAAAFSDGPRGSMLKACLQRAGPARRGVRVRRPTGPGGPRLHSAGPVRPTWHGTAARTWRHAPG